MTYTASEMRRIADGIEPHPLTKSGYMLDPDKAREAAQALRQAADAMEAERHKALDELTALSQELGLYAIPTLQDKEQG